MNETQLNDVKLRIERALDLHSLLDFEGVTQKINSNQMGNSLIQEPFIHDALLTIGLIREQQSGEDLCRLIHSPFLVNEEDNGSTRAELDTLFASDSPTYAGCLIFCTSPVKHNKIIIALNSIVR